MPSSMTPRVPLTNPPQISFSDEIARKTTHMFALIIPGGYYLLGLEKSTMLMIMVPIFLFTFAVDFSRLRDGTLWRFGFKRLFSSMIRAHEAAGNFTGATYILGTTVATVALFAKPVAVAALAFIIVGDTFAAIIGRRFGRHKFLGNKSLEGSLACLAGTIIVALVTPGLPLIPALAGAVVATVTEAISRSIDDNVSVPLISGLTLTLLT